jgi:PAS domain S-box-containing protein
MSVVKILLVEDESIEAMDIKRTLESFGYQVPYVASRGEEAIKKALELMPDLILMDIILKGEINGIEAVSEINKLNIPVIYLTAHSEESTIERAKLTMPYGYILKPYDAVELKYAVELALYKNKMEKELKESGKKFHLLFDNSPLPYQSLDENGFFLDVNQVWLDCLGYSKDEVIGKNFAQFLAPGYTEQFKKNFPIFKSAGEIHDVEFEMKHKDGSHIFVSFEGKIGYDELGRFKQTHCIFQDISQRIKAEKNLKESETYYKALFEHSGVATVIIDENTTISLANTEFEKLSGYKRGEIEGKMSWTEFVVKEDLEKMKERHNLRRTDISAVPTRYEFKFIDRGGNIKDIQLEADMIPGTKKSSAFLLDITEAKKAEKQLLKSQKHLKKRDEEFKHFIDSAPVAIAMFDTQMRYIAVSNRWIEDYNFQGQELTGKSHYDVFPEITDELKEVHKRALAGSIVSADDDKFVRADGSIQYVKWEVQPWYTSPAEIGGIIIFSEDITERVKAENEVKKSEKRLKMGMSIANLAYWEYDVKSDMFTFNDQFYSLYGTSKQQEGSYQMSSQEYTKRFIPPEESPIVAKEVAKALKTDDPDYFATVQHRIIRPDGKERFMLIRIVVVKDEKGQTIRTMGVNQDITELKLIEKI